ncbi:MAG: Endonuclease III [candidate division Zixibacteria bacterium RBG-1]|nr:MAG: Endonuclease III [candidate division Zixibacteria bacterium RBG-1]OGC83499.1 MAG: endonuclease III [candidate division Zixibacteria bacterium RBG_19FT_COMBO_42_43]
MFKIIRESFETKKKRAKKIIALLKKEYPDAKCSLNFKNPLELMVATILSAQCTDARVNIVTKTLFKKYRKTQDYYKVPQEEFEQDIKSTGFFRNKAKAIQSACKVIAEKYRGKVPKTMEELTSLNGIGRKTANVILGNAYGIASGIAVDTHVTRLSHRLGLSYAKTPEKIEQELMKLVPQSDWILFPHLLIWHGRKICQARNPKSPQCVLNKICPSSLA